MADPPRRVERLLNVLACLLDTSVPLTQEQIAQEVGGYPESKSARRRSFERDKETLRAMGVPLRVEPVPFGDGNDVGYRVDPHEYYLPPLSLTNEEQTALNVAASAVSLGDSASRGALMKLGGLSGDAVPPIAALPIAPSLPAIFEAWRRRATVTFTYRDEARTIDVWALRARRGRWYAVGYDHDRDAVRTFRADRIAEPVELGAGGQFEVPDDFRPEAYEHDEPWTWGSDPAMVVDLLVDAGDVESVASAVGDAPRTPSPDGSGTVFHVTVTNRSAFRTLVLGFRDRVEVQAPPEMRSEIVSWLERLVET